MRKDEGKRPLGRSSNRGDGSIKTDFKETGLEGLDWVYRDVDMSLVRPGRKQATATEDIDVHISYLLS